MNFHKLGLFSLQNSYLWFLLLGKNFHILGFGFVAIPIFYFFIVEFQVSHLTFRKVEKISSTMNMHDFAFNFKFPLLVFVGCGSNNNINNLGFPMGFQILGFFM